MEEIKTIQIARVSNDALEISAESDYVLILPEGFDLAYDDALQDALSMVDNHKIACFGTIYEADNANKFDYHWQDPFLTPAASIIINHPSAFMAYVLSREIYTRIQLIGRNIYEAIIGVAIEQPIDECFFVPLYILTTSLHACDIDKQIDTASLKQRFYKAHSNLAEDYKYLFAKRNIVNDEETAVLEKFGKTRFFRLVMMLRELLKSIGIYKVKANYKYKKYIKKVKFEDKERIADIAARIEKLPFKMLQAKGDSSDVVVSLTTHGNRLCDSAPFGIYSLFTQTFLPNRIVLCVNQDIWNENNLPPLIKRLQKSGLEVLFCRDVRSYTKLLPVLAKFPNNPIITVDDDMCYEPHMIEELVTAYEKSDKKTVLCRQGVYPKMKDGKYIPYSQWDNGTKMSDYMQNRMKLSASPFGVYGVLYPPHIFDEEVFKDDVFLKLAPHTDDIWFWVQEIRCGIRAEVVRPTKQHDDVSVSLMEYLEESESSALFFFNCFHGGNDKEMYALLDYYKTQVSQVILRV